VRDGSDRTLRATCISLVHHVVYYVKDEMTSPSTTSIGRTIQPGAAAVIPPTKLPACDRKLVAANAATSMANQQPKEIPEKAKIPVRRGEVSARDVAAVVAQQRSHGSGSDAVVVTEINQVGQGLPRRNEPFGS